MPRYAFELETKFEYLVECMDDWPSVWASVSRILSLAATPSEILVFTHECRDDSGLHKSDLHALSEANRYSFAALKTQFPQLDPQLRTTKPQTGEFHISILSIAK
jgi:hypothetical protein